MGQVRIEKLDGEGLRNLNAMLTEIYQRLGPLKSSGDLEFALGKFLKTEAKCSVYLSTDQLNIANDVYVKVLLDTVIENPSGMWDAANKRIVIKIPGWYLLLGSVGYSDNVADKRYFSAITVNGTARGVSISQTSFTGLLVIPCHTPPWKCAVNDYIELYARQTTGGTTPDILGASEYTWLGVHLLSKS